MRYWWISWVQTSDDYRPLRYPPNWRMLGWWCTGESEEGNILVAWVAADCKAEACVPIFTDWPESVQQVDKNGFRFFDEVDAEWRPNDRFPLSDWMQERVEKHFGQEAAE